MNKDFMLYKLKKYELKLNEDYSNDIYQKKVNLYKSLLNNQNGSGDIISTIVESGKKIADDVKYDFKKITDVYVDRYKRDSDFQKSMVTNVSENIKDLGVVFDLNIREKEYREFIKSVPIEKIKVFNKKFLDRLFILETEYKSLKESLSTDKTKKIQNINNTINQSFESIKNNIDTYIHKIIELITRCKNIDTCKDDCNTKFYDLFYDINALDKKTNNEFKILNEEILTMFIENGFSSSYK